MRDIGKPGGVMGREEEAEGPEQTGRATITSDAEH